jgi:RNA polymerase sigma-B factor
VALHEMETNRACGMTEGDRRRADQRVTGARSATDERSRLIEAHLGLARHLAGLFERRGESREDLQQVASLALVRSADRFDPSLGFAFSTFATSTIMGELKRHLRDRAWAVKMPRSLQELYLEVNTAVNELTQSLKRSPSVAEVAAACNRRDDEVLSAMEAGHGYRASSLDAPGADGESTDLAAAGDSFGSLVDSDELASHLARLAPRERDLIRLRFVEELSQAEIASRMSMSQMHVSRLLRRAVDELRRSYGVATDP